MVGSSLAGCCTATKKPRLSGVNTGPHISAPVGVRKNMRVTARPRPVVSQAQMPSPMPFADCCSPWSVAIQSRPWPSKAMLSGQANQPEGETPAP